MQASDLLKPRFIIGALGLLVVLVLVVTESITGQQGIAIIIGILVAFGAYYMESPRTRKARRG